MEHKTASLVAWRRCKSSQCLRALLWFAPSQTTKSIGSLKFHTASNTAPAVAFGGRYRTIGLDSNKAKVAAIRAGVDATGEVSREQLAAANGLSVTSDTTALRDVDIVIVAVPTPVNEALQPDFEPLRRSSEAVGRNLKRGATLVYESTVYPGATEEVCIPILERTSGMIWRKNFSVG